jgi:hypothetical protein
MTIKTKYKYDDEVFMLHYNRIAKVKIVGLKFEGSKEHEKIRYVCELEDTRSRHEIAEENLFATIDALKASL